MKKILFLLLSLNVFVLSNDTFDDFINKQIKIEGQLLDQNLSLEKKMDITKSQKKQYKAFFILYTTEQEKHMQNSNPYRDTMSKLKLRLNSNKHRGYAKAVMRDEVLLRGYKIRSGIQTAFHHILQQTNSKSEDFFRDKISETLVENFAKLTPLDTKKYTVANQDKSSTISQSLQSAVQEVKGLENIAYTFAAAIVENSSTIYNTARFSKSKIFALMNTLDNSNFVQKANTYLSAIHLDAAKIILLFMVIVLILIFQSIIRFIINVFLKYYKFKEDDISYIHTHITKIFNYITSLLIIHLILISYAGFSSSSINITKLFTIMYIILTTLLFYRITNTIAYMKMESIRKSKILKNEVVNLAIKVLNVLIVLLAIISILKILGVDLTAILSGLGIAGAAIAFAAKDSIANIFASVSILIGDIFEQGEWIETKDVNGTVVEIGLRASTIRTFDNALISIPNSELANTGVKNWSRRSIGRRIKMNIGVTYQSSFDDIRQAITEIKEMLKEHPGIANERTSYENTYRQAKLVSTEDFKGVKRTTLVYMDEFSDSSINILVYCFSRTVDWSTWLEVKEDVMYKIADIIEKNNLDFAYKTLTLHQAEEEPFHELNSSL
ncbi:mechanosensitive ion channel family protein [Sulfurovum sp.]|uniref:mechanosensitive ion channel family protein n=1 Tax=Sulfurovum sp. TaxID=1969726 RepID=UPI002867D3FC|nr:mechanosensitive ion channel family protein [Sulfurovum sp.]